MSLSAKFRQLNRDLRGIGRVLRTMDTEPPRTRIRPRTKRGDGATAKRLERLLEKAGYVVDFMMPTRGYYLHTVADCWRWEAWGWSAADTAKRGKLHFYSWDTMTECVREGLVVDIDEDGACWVSSLKSTSGRTTPEIAHRGRGGV